jgi:hypothetical protein
MSKKSRKRARAIRKGAGPAIARKEAARFAAKTAGMVPCHDGHLNEPGGNCCVDCGNPMPGVPVPPLSAVNKSAFAYNFWVPRLRYSHSSDDREMLNKALYGQNGGQA